MFCHNTHYDDCWTGNFSSNLYGFFGTNSFWILEIVKFLKKKTLDLTSISSSFYRYKPRRTSAELLAQTKTTWPLPITTLLFSPHFKFVTPFHLFQTYEFHGVIASGAFGTVYRVVDRNERNVCALKVLQKSQVNLWLHLICWCDSSDIQN